MTGRLCRLFLIGLIEQLFECLRALITKKDMSPFPIIKRFQIEEDILPCLVTRTISFPAYPLPFELAEETFCDRIIPAVSSAAHAAQDSITIKHRGEGFAGVLAPLVAMMQQAEARLSLLDSRLQRTAGQLGICPF